MSTVALHGADIRGEPLTSDLSSGAPDIIKARHQAKPAEGFYQHELGRASPWHLVSTGDACSATRRGNVQGARASR